jgi:hypothetical protein
MGLKDDQNLQKISKLSDEKGNQKNGKRVSKMDLMNEMSRKDLSEDSQS